MKKYLSVVLAGTIGVFFLGCSSKKVTIKAIMPANVDTLTKKRDIAIIPFKGDTINFTGRLETKLANVRINNKSYFHIIDRDRIGDVLKELRFQASDLVGNKAAKFGKLAGAQVLITGNVKTSAKNGYYKKPAKICDYTNQKGRCLHYKMLYVTCQTANASLNTSINAIDVNSAQVIDAINISKNYQADSCEDGGFFSFGHKKILTAQQALNKLADEAADEYINRVAPHYITMQIELIDEVESIDINDNQEKKFENALTYIKHGRIEKAEYLLKQLNEETGEKSYEIAYDLGVVEESLGKLEEAKAAYNLADNIIINTNTEPNELLDKALKRINMLIQKRKELEKQGVK